MVMMVHAYLQVVDESEKDADGNPKDERWGEYQFSTLPRVGELISAFRDHDYQIVRVQKVKHFAIEHPLPESEGLAQRKNPSLLIIATWCGFE